MVSAPFLTGLSSGLAAFLTPAFASGFVPVFAPGLASDAARARAASIAVRVVVSAADGSPGARDDSPATRASRDSRSASSAAVGRRAGSRCRAARTSGSSAAGTPTRSALPFSTAYICDSAVPRPKVGRPVAANATVAAQPCTSAGAPTVSSAKTSGAQ